MTDTEALVAEPVLEIKSFQLNVDLTRVVTISMLRESLRLRYLGEFGRRQRRV